jgi:hypothetical protein
VVEGGNRLTVTEGVERSFVSLIEHGQKLFVSACLLTLHVRFSSASKGLGIIPEGFGLAVLALELRV